MSPSTAKPNFAGRRRNSLISEGVSLAEGNKPMFVN
jgi:hypothetical protein